MTARYTVAQKGDLAGLPGWWTVHRDKNPIQHLATEADAKAFAYLCEKGRTEKEAAAAFYSDGREA